MEENKNKNKRAENQAIYKGLNLKTVSIFENDIQIVFIFKKTEKLASAIYLITSFISDNEPIKWKIREVSTRLLSYGINLSNQGHRSRVDAMNNFLSASLEIISLLEISNISGIISPMNYSVLRFEIEKIVELVDLKERSLNSKFLLSKNFFEITEGQAIIQNRQEDTNKVFSLKDNKASTDQTSGGTTASSEDLIKGHYNRQQFVKDIKNEKNGDMSFNKGQVPKGDRYEIIINLLKNTKEISVKDVSSLISDCSEKTIQRELLSLVDKGVLKKEGERRWSKYSLV